MTEAKSQWAYLDGISKLQIYKKDCVNMMSKMESNMFDLAIVDPPYGIDVTKMSLGKHEKRSIRRELYRGEKDWDSAAPGKEYFDELFRVSKNQIMFGANHYIENFAHLGLNSSCWIVWDKDNGETDYADCELAWSSFKKPVRRFKHPWYGFMAKERNEEDRIHPTQKPIALYRWLLTKFAEPGQHILDTHMGSGSSAIACKFEGMHYTGYEIDNGHFVNAVKRIQEKTKQHTLW